MKKTQFLSYLLLSFCLTSQPAAAVLKRIASQGSLVKAATGQETTTWEKIKAGLFLYIQLDDIKQLKDDTENLIKLTGDVIRSNIDTIEKIYAAQVAEEKKQPTKAGKKPAINNFWTAQLKKIKDEILTLQARTIKELTNLDLKEFIDPNTRSSFMDIISQMNDSFDKTLDIIPQPIKDELFTSVKRKANSMISNNDEDDDPLNVTTSQQIRPAAKPTATKPLTKSESSEWDDTDQPVTRPSKPAARANTPLSKKPSSPALVKKPATSTLVKKPSMNKKPIAINPEDLL